MQVESVFLPIHHALFIKLQHCAMCRCTRSGIRGQPTTLNKVQYRQTSSPFFLVTKYIAIIFDTVYLMIFILFLRTCVR